MNKQKPSLFIFSILAIIIGAALYKQIDFQPFQIEKPVLSAIYFITLVFCLALIIKSLKKNK